MIQKDAGTLMFTAGLLTIAKTWKQLKCPSTEEQLKKMWDIHTEILLSHKNGQNNAICSDTEGPRDSHTE